MTNGYRLRPVGFKLPRALACLIFFVAAFHLTTAVATKNPLRTELLIIEEAGCVYCAKFNREIAPIYGKTTEGKKAPLRRIDLHTPWPDDLAGVQGDSVTPTFILIHDQTEIGRLRGYQGDEFFWFLLNELLDKLPVSGADQ